MQSLYRFIAVLICISIMGVSLPAVAQVPEAKAQPQTINILKTADYLRDPSGSLKLRDLLRPNAAKIFRPYTLDILKAADPNSVHWFRFDITAPRDAPYRATLYFTDPRLQRAALYRQVVGANAEVIRFDPSAAIDDTVTTRGGIGLPLWVDRGQTNTVYLSLEGPKLSGRLEIWQPHALTVHLKQQRLQRIALGTVLGIAGLLALYAAIRKTHWSWLFLSAACAAYGAHLHLSSGPVQVPSWLGSLDVLLLLAVIVVASIQQYVVSLARTDAAFPIIRWWSVVSSAALFMSAVLSALFPGPALLFSYVFFLAAIGMCVFVAIALITFKTALFYHLKAFLAAALAGAISLVPRWPFEISDESLWPQMTVCAALLCACILCWWPRRAFAAKKGENTGVDTFAIKSMLAFDQVQVEDGQFMDQISDHMSEPQGDPAPQEVETQGVSSAAEDVHPSQYGRPNVFDTYAFDTTAFDEMTGVLNAATVSALGNKAIAQVKRYNRPYTAMLMRIDGLNEMRDLLGQVTADRAAKLLAVTAMRELRESDALGRLRDDCFVALLPETDLPGARSALLRTKANIDERTVPTRAGMKKLDVSAAITQFQDDDIEFDQVIERLFNDLALEIDEEAQKVAARGSLPPHAAE
jgi:diguanylate cyclase (GGDEF)-like protein